MTTTDLYSGYDRDGKPTSRVLRPPGGGSSNIFGTSEPPQQQLRKQEQREMVDSNQNQAMNNASAPPPPSQAQAAQQPKKKGYDYEAPYAENDNDNRQGRHKSSQNEEDFRCHSVTAYREAVVRNAAVREKAHGGKATAANPITHQDKNDEARHNEYVTTAQQQQSHAAAASRGYGSKGHRQSEEIREDSAMPRHSLMDYKDAVNRNAELRHKYHGGGEATGSFNPITHQEFTGEGLQPTHYQYAPPPFGQEPRPAPQPQSQPMQQADLRDRENYGRREIIRASSYNPITGEEYPEDYGKKRGEAAKNGEDKDKTQDNKDVICTPTPAQTPTGTPGANSTPNATETNNTPNTPSSAGTKQRPSSRVLQPPGGASSGLW